MVAFRLFCFDKSTATSFLRCRVRNTMGQSQLQGAAACSLYLLCAAALLVAVQGHGFLYSPPARNWLASPRSGRTESQGILTYTPQGGNGKGECGRAARVWCRGRLAALPEADACVPHPPLPAIYICTPNTPTSITPHHHTHHPAPCLPPGGPLHRRRLRRQL